MHLSRPEDELEMPLQYVRRRLTAESVLTVAVATTTVTRELADMAQFPPARAAASLLLVIFQTIQVRRVHHSTVLQPEVESDFG